MAKVKMQSIVRQLSYDMKRALRDTVSREYCQTQIDHLQLLSRVSQSGGTQMLNLGGSFGRSR